MEQKEFGFKVQAYIHDSWVVFELGFLITLLI
jgi:hypothetical protein